MKNIFLDFDGLKFNTTPLLVTYMNEKYSINTTEKDYLNMGSALEQIVYKHRPDLAHITRDQVYLDYSSEFANSIESHKAIEPIDGMCEVVNLLVKKYRIYTVTARQESGKHVVRHILERFIPGCVTDIHCVWYRGDGEYIKRPKIDFIKKVGGKHAAFFDDSVHEIHDMQDFIPSFLFNPPGSSNDITGIKQHVPTWHAFGEKLL